MIKGSKYFKQTVFFFSLLLLIFGDSNNKTLMYFPLVIMSLMTIIFVFTNLSERLFNKYDIIPIGLLFLWFYGVALGLIYGNKNVFINNIGILYFIVYFYIKYSKIETSFYVNILYFVCALSLFVGVYDLLTNPQLVLNLVIGQRTLFSLISIMPIILFPLFFYNVFFNSGRGIFIKSKLISILLLLLILLVSVVLTASKGIYLYVVFVFVIFLITFYRVRLKSILLLLVMIFASFYFISQNEIFTIFGSEDPSNENRYMQLDAIYQELTFFGKGWGAKYLHSYLYRDENGYSIELSYHNLVHKIGIFAAFYFAAYIFILYRSVLLIKGTHTNNVKMGLFSLGSTYYFFMALGNPVLFAGINVMITAVSLSIINSKNI